MSGSTAQAPHSPTRYNCAISGHSIKQSTAQYVSPLVNTHFGSKLTVQVSTILSRGSSHESSSPDTAADKARRAEPAAGLDAALAAVNQALGRLNRTGTSIRRLPTTSNTLIVEPDIPGSQEFKKAALSCVQALYSRASPELQEHLGESITAARNDVITRKLRQEQRMTRAHRIIPLEALPEDESTTLTSQGTTHWPPATMTLPAELGIQRPKSERSAVSGSSASELSRSERSSIENSLSITNLTAPSSYVRPKAQKKSTFSVQGNQIYYPLPPQPRKNSNFITCEWCLETHSKELLEGSNWRYAPVHIYFCQLHICSQVYM